MMTKKEAIQITGGIGFTSKTGLSYGLPAITTCKTGATLRCCPRSVCHGCYGNKGRYGVPVTKRAQARRMTSVLRLDKDAGFNSQWVDAMAHLINFENNKLDDNLKNYFRWHDSGDIVSSAYLTAIAAVARRLPNIKFWIPTKEVELVTTWVKTNDIPSNLCIRLSGFYVDEAAKYTANLPVSNVHTSEPLGHACPAIEAHKSCAALGCRKCWNKRVRTVSYKKH